MRKKTYEYWEFDQFNERIKIYDSTNEEIAAIDLVELVESWLEMEGYEPEDV